MQSEEEKGEGRAGGRGGEKGGGGGEREYKGLEVQERSDSFSAAMVPESLLYTSFSFLAIIGSLGQGALGNIHYTVPYFTILCLRFRSVEQIRDAGDAHFTTVGGRMVRFKAVGCKTANSLMQTVRCEKVRCK